MTQAIKRAYMNYLNTEQKYERRNKKSMAEQGAAAKGLLAPRTARATNNNKQSKVDEFQPVFDAIQMIRNRGS